MSQRIVELSIGKLAKLSGVSVRTLHHYDAKGLLPPAHTALNGYRSYGRAEQLRLQEILFYRAVGMALSEIADLLDGPVAPVDRLKAHRGMLVEQAADAAERLRVLDQTIAHLKGKTDMTNEDLYTPFSPEKQAGHEAWLVEKYGADMAARIGQSKGAVADLPEGIKGAMEELADIEAGLVALFEAGEAAESDANRGLLEQHRALMRQLWGRECTPEAHAGLGEMYQSHPDFITRYEALSPRFSAWLPAAMASNARNKAP